MAPPDLPNGLSLHDLGFAALKYPALPAAPYNIPLANMIGALQRQQTAAQNHTITQIASQFITSLIEYQMSDEPTLRDPDLPQYYFSTALHLLSFLSGSPDVAKRMAATPNFVNSVIEKLLADDFVANMKSIHRPMVGGFPPAGFEEDFGSVLQFVSTMLLYKDVMEPLHPRINELIPKLRTWKQTYKNSRVRTISNAAERTIDQIRGLPQSQITMMRTMLDSSLVCGVTTCRISGADRTTLCSSCRIQRYCGREHQKADWKYHKHICNKGLDETSTT